jgi:uncharacterized protein (DUF433 family)
MGKERPIVLDPQRSLGKPIDNGSGIPTMALYQTWRAGEPVERIARWYSVQPDVVDAAIKYEDSLLQAA